MRQEQSRCKGLRKRLGDMVLTDLTSSAVSDYREIRLTQVSPKTVKEELSLLQRVFNVSLKDWVIKLPNNASPLDLVRKPRGENASERRLSQGEYQVISQIPIFNWAIETAMRRREIAAMDWRHVDQFNASCVPGDQSSGTLPIACSHLTRRGARSSP